MKPLDLPPDNPDWLHAALCRPAEVREHESYISNPADDDGHERVDAPSQPPPPEPALLPPGGSSISQPQQYPELRNGLFVFSVPLPLRARDRKSTRLNSSHIQKSRMPSSA